MDFTKFFLSIKYNRVKQLSRKIDRLARKLIQTLNILWGKKKNDFSFHVLL